MALHLVCLRVMHSKRDPKSMQGILQLQSDHLRKFVKAYSRDACRPKHHFQFHHEHQSMEVGYQFDCFCMERKNKAFKGGILPNISRIEDLERTALARWLQIDAASTLKNCPALYGNRQVWRCCRCLQQIHEKHCGWLDWPRRLCAESI